MKPRYAPGHESCAICIAPDACPGCLAQAVQPGYCLDCEKHDEALSASIEADARAAGREI